MRRNQYSIVVGKAKPAVIKAPVMVLAQGYSVAWIVVVEQTERLDVGCLNNERRKSPTRQATDDRSSAPSWAAYPGRNRTGSSSSTPSLSNRFSIPVVARSIPIHRAAAGPVDRPAAWPPQAVRAVRQARPGRQQDAEDAG